MAGGVEKHNCCREVLAEGRRAAPGREMEECPKPGLQWDGSWRSPLHPFPGSTGVGREGLRQFLYVPVWKCCWQHPGHCNQCHGQATSKIDLLGYAAHGRAALHC